MINYYKIFMERFEAMSMAVAFAEVGEWKTAKEIMDVDSKTDRKKLEKQHQPKTRPRSGLRIN